VRTSTCLFISGRKILSGLQSFVRDFEGDRSLDFERDLDVERDGLFEPDPEPRRDFDSDIQGIN